MIGKKDGFCGERSVVLPPAVVRAQEDDMLCRSLFITDIGHYPKAELHHRERRKAISEYVLIYCVDGRGYYVVDGHRHDVSRNQYFILPAGHPHEYGSAEGHHWTIYWVHFRGLCASVYAEGATMPHDISVALNSRISERIDIFEEIITTLRAGQELEDLRYASSLLHHFLASMRYLCQYRRASSDVPAYDIVEQAIHFMRENIEQRIVMADVLRYVGYSQTHLSTLFRQKTGQSPIAFFNRLKIDHACRLLLHTDLKINQICFKVGIDDALYFSRLFSKLMGMSPSEYRLRMRS